MRLSPVLALTGALLAATASAPAWAGSVTPTPAPSSSAPAPSATPAPSPTAPVPAPSPSSPPPATEVSGTLRITPTSGPAGTKITVTPSAPCVATDGSVAAYADVILMNKANFDSPKPFEPEVERLVSTDDSGAWTTTLTVPAKVKAGVPFVVDAICLTAKDESAIAVRVYAPVRFTISAPSAPVATPVTGDPKFTG